MNSNNQYDWVTNLLFVTLPGVGSYHGGVVPPRNSTQNVWARSPQWDNVNHRQLPGTYNQTMLSLIRPWIGGTGVMREFPYDVTSAQVPGAWNNWGQQGGGGPCGPRGCPQPQYNTLVSPNLLLQPSRDAVDDALYSVQSSVQRGRFPRFSKGNSSAYKVANEVFPAGAIVFREYDAALHVVEFDLQSYFAYIGNQQDFPFVGLQMEGNPSWCPPDQTSPKYNGDPCGTGVTIVAPSVNIDQSGYGDMNRYLTWTSSALLRSARGNRTGVRLGVRPMPYTFTPENQQDYVRGLALSLSLSPRAR